MRTIIFYVAKTPLTSQHMFIQPAGMPPCFIRTEVIDGDLLDGLDQAKPLEGETVLNSWSPYAQS